MATARAAARVATGSAGGVRESVLALVNGGLHAMLIAKLKTVGLSMLAVAVLVAGAYGLGAQAPAERPNHVKERRVGQAPAPPAPVPEEPRMSTEKLVAKLNEPVNIDKEIENSSLKDVLSFLTDQYGVRFIVNVQAVRDSR
jgi:hypothetical protein